MNPLEYATTLASYNRWMNGRIYAACAQLSGEQRKRDVGAFFKSIHGTLNHLLLGDRLWLGRFTRVPFTFRSLDQELYAEFDELRTQRNKTDDEIVAWAHSLSSEEFAGHLSYMSVVDPQLRTSPFWVAVTQLFSHQIHHRGQVTTLLVQQGVDPGATDLIWLPDLQANVH